MSISGILIEISPTPFDLTWNQKARLGRGDSKPFASLLDQSMGKFRIMDVLDGGNLAPNDCDLRKKVLRVGFSSLMRKLEWLFIDWPSNECIFKGGELVVYVGIVWGRWSSNWALPFCCFNVRVYDVRKSIFVKLILNGTFGVSYHSRESFCQGHGGLTTSKWLI